MHDHSPPRPWLGSAVARRLLLGSVGVGGFSRITRLAALALRAPVATLGVAEGDRLVLVGQTGVPEPWRGAGYIPLHATFCRHVLSAGDTFAVDDAGRHLLGYSVARLDSFVRVAYCGSPLVVEGEVVAVLSVCDARPRHWPGDDVSLMRDLASAALRDLEVLAARLRSAGGVLPDPSPRAFAGHRSVAGDAAGGGDDRVSRPEWPGAVPAAAAPVPGPLPAAAPAGPPSDAGASPPPPGFAVAALPDGVLTVDVDFRLTYLNDRCRELLRLGDREVTGTSFWELFPGLQGTNFQEQFGGVARERRPLEVETLCACADAWLEVRAWPLDEGGVALQLRDVSQRRSVQEELRSRESLYRRLFQESRTPLFVMAQDGMLLEVNGAFAELLGRPAEALAGAPLSRLAADSHACGRMLAVLQETGSVADAEVAFLHGSGEEMVCTVSGVAQQGSDGLVYSASLRDVTQDRRAREELLRSAYNDPLTALPNRAVFMDRLERVLQHSRRRRPHAFAVLFLDLDNFKYVNDNFGHLAGDELLVVVARRLESCVRQEDTVARIGGDEFAILLETISDITDVRLVVDRIRKALDQALSCQGREVQPRASIGIAISMDHYDRAEDMLRDADTAMYRAKASGSNDYVIFDHEMHARIMAQRQLETDLRDAVAGEQLALHYHPEVQLDTGSVTGMEALLRWPHPERGVLLPADFIPLAEQTGLIVELGWWVLREACRQLRSWQLECPDAEFKLTMSVNLSARQFVHPELLTKLQEVLEETGLDPACLRLDLTEAVVMRNADVAAQLLPRIRELGVHICIDDFGTGFTSLRQLRELPISTLKIDRSFVQRLGEGGQGLEIVQSIIALGRSMAIDAIAEGVETPEQLAQLRRMGTRFAQGFLFSLPLDTRAAGALLQETYV
jgi:diguanylate cyclase (GGDEF)-like protein/PAS domain S-box-containing protein